MHLWHCAVSTANSMVGKSQWPGAREKSRNQGAPSTPQVLGMVWGVQIWIFLVWGCEELGKNRELFEGIEDSFHSVFKR